VVAWWQARKTVLEQAQDTRCPFHKFTASHAAARLYGLGG